MTKRKQVKNAAMLQEVFTAALQGCPLTVCKNLTTTKNLSNMAEWYFITHRGLETCIMVQQFEIIC